MNKHRLLLREAPQWERMPCGRRTCKLRVEFTGVDCRFKRIKHRRKFCDLPERHRLPAYDHGLAIGTRRCECHASSIVSGEPLPAGLCGLVHVKRGSSLM
jgi:hypothetical protein